MRIPDIAISQGGLFTRNQARMAGIAYSTIRRALACGDWHEPLPGVLTALSAPLPRSMYLQAIAIGCRATLSHLTAAELHGWSLNLGGSEIHVTTSRSHNPTTPNLVVHRLGLPASDVVEIDGVPTTSASRTALDLIAWLPEGESQRFRYRALQQGWIRERDLGEAMPERRYQAGSESLRDFDRRVRTRPHSVAESQLHPVLDFVCQGRWRANVELTLRDGAVVVVDALVDGVLVIEVDGYEFHADEQAFQRDRDRQNELVLAGYVVVRFTALDVMERPAHVRAVVAEASALVGRGTPGQRC